MDASGQPGGLHGAPLQAGQLDGLRSHNLRRRPFTVDVRGAHAALASITMASITMASIAMAALLGCSTAEKSHAPPAPSSAVSARASDSSAQVAAPQASAKAPAADPQGRAQLEFKDDGRSVRSLRRSQLQAAIASEDFSAFDPYYQKPKRYRALPIEKVLRVGFAPRKLDELKRLHFVLKARDGYTVPIEGSRLLEGGAYIAIADLEMPSWQPIGPQQANPGPYYLVWRNKDQTELRSHPRPWQLATIAIAPFDKTFPKTVPAGLAAGELGWRGFKLFREQCIRCHAINQQGGRVGPELNIPQSIVEYRPEEQIRAYIKNPLTFRYGNMPSNPHLTQRDLDSLIAYFQAMKTRKVVDARTTTH